MAPRIHQVELEAIIGLRARVLRPGRPLQTALFEEDHHPCARHLGAFEGGAVVGCVSLVQSSWENRPAWRLRAMAVHPEHRRRGVGTLLLRELERMVRDSSGPGLLWCSARVEAIAFYEKRGWEIASRRFEIPGVGPHKKMVRRLTACGDCSGETK